jgi:hypothetical protein
MPKKECCCGVTGSYIAIPCRWASVKNFSGVNSNINFDFFYPHREGGNFNGDVNGPFRFFNGIREFDTTRDVVYMIRGAGGGGGGPYLPAIDNEQRHGLGGNGAYVQHEKKAALDDVVRPGSGGSGGVNYSNSYANPTFRKRGGDAVSVSGEGGDAAFLAKEGNVQGEFSEMNVISVAGGGGGGSVVIGVSPSSNGGRKGGHAGITLAEKGEDGISSFGTVPIGGGNGATDIAGGTALNGSSPDPSNRNAKDGTSLGGGRAARRFESTTNTNVGYGGGGGGGLFGGGGGAIDGGGGGGSSKGNTLYAFPPRDDYPSNYCNPYLTYNSGVGGKRVPSVLNNTLNGTDGEISQYYIYAFCECDPSKNIIPDPLFICLNSDQAQYILEQAGDPPPAIENGIPVYYSLLFVYEGETYVLTGSCVKDCETPYKIPSSASFTDMKYSRSTQETSPAWENPPCCSQVLCTPLCPLEGVNCAQCGCPEFNELLVCCETADKPDLYYSIYNGWIYSCKKNNNNWIIPGEISQNVTVQCLDPINPAPQCQREQEDCSETINETNNRCEPLLCPGLCDNYSITVSVNNLVYKIYCFVDTETNPCIERSSAFSHTFNNITPGQYSYSELLNECPVGNDVGANGVSYLLDWGFQIDTNLTEENKLLLTIEFDCIPPVDEFNAYPYSIPSSTGTWVICGASVTAGNSDGSGGAYLGTIVSKLNSKLAGRVTLTTNYPDVFWGECSPINYAGFYMLDDISSGVLVVKVYSDKYFMRACGDASIVAGSQNCGVSSKSRLFESAPLDTWNMPSVLNLSACSCTSILDEFGNPTGYSNYPNCCGGNLGGEITFSPCDDLIISG